MKRILTVYLSVIVWACVFAVPASAEIKVRGHMYLSLSPTGYQCTGTAIAFTPFDLYMIVHVPDMVGAEIFGWEATINMPASASVLSTTCYPATAGCGPFKTGRSYVVGTGVPVGDVPFVAMKLSIISLSDPGENYHFNLGPAVPPTGNTGGPVWLHVDETIRVPAGDDPVLGLPGWPRGYVTMNQNDATVVIEENCSGIVLPAEVRSWGTLKAGSQE